jgi:hypothetical protein
MNRTVLFLDGTSQRCQVHVCGGACLVGWPTAYVIRDNQTVWVKPGESVSFVETNADGTL